MSSFTIIAKAGGSDEAAENTCEAVRAALATKPPDWARLAIEVDVRMAADGSLVVIHDESVDRTTNGRGLVRELTVERLRALSAGANGERIPILEEIFESSGDHELVIEVHDSSGDAAAAVVETLHRANDRILGRVIVASEHTNVIRSVRELDPRVRTAATSRAAWGKLVLDGLGLSRWAPRGHTWMVPEVHRGLRVVTSRFVQSAARAGDDVWVFVVNDRASVLRLREMGATGCFATRPAQLSRSLG